MKTIITAGLLVLSLGCAAKEVKPDLSLFATKAEVVEVLTPFVGATNKLNERLNVVEKIVDRREESCPCK